MQTADKELIARAGEERLEMNRLVLRWPLPLRRSVQGQSQSLLQQLPQCGSNLEKLQAPGKKGEYSKSLHARL